MSQKRNFNKACKRSYLEIKCKKSCSQNCFNNRGGNCKKKETWKIVNRKEKEKEEFQILQMEES